jgi:flagellum-specific ATP synthase
MVARVRGAPLALGQLVDMEPGGGAPSVRGEVVGFDGEEALVMPFGDLQGLGARTAVFPAEPCLEVPVGERVLGRVMDGTGKFRDGGPTSPDLPRRPVRAEGPDAVARPPVTRPLPLGVRVLDSVLTCAEGGRLGLFAAAGVGKSVLLGMVARHARVDAVVLCLVGERGREVNDLLAQVRSPHVACVVATAADPPLARARAPLVAQAVAESLRDEGRHVLLLMDSLTRYAQALREIGLARGEAPAARGYPPSALAGLAPLLERAGPTERGTITGLYTVLVEGDDPDEPVADAARSFLDGHIELSRRLARAGLYPAVDPAASISRLQEKVVAPDAYARAVRFRALWAAYEEGRDLIQVGAYRPGSDPRLDEAVQRRQVFEDLVAQGPDEVVDYEAASSALAAALGDGGGDEGECG